MMLRNNKKTRRSGRVVLLLLLLSLSLFFTQSAAVIAPQYAKERAVFSSAVSREGSTERLFCPGGMNFGVKLSTKGVLVVGFSRSAKGGECPAEKAGLATKDVIEKINGRVVNTVSELIGCIEGCGGNKVVLEVNRGGEKRTVSFLPAKDESGAYRAGIWVRDSTAGIGTVTLVDPNSGEFWGLGHGICDGDTGVLMPLLRGSVYDISAVSIRKGKAGAPGELKGYFSPSLCGILLKNTMQGVFGRFSDFDRESLSEPMPLASRDEVKVGDATLYATLTGESVSKYSVRINKITSPKGDTKNFVIEVTDPRLLEETGGIVQGMSGSTIVQNGKIVGAVTHVMVNDPTTGYGIFIENMLNAAQMPIAKAS